MIEVKTVDMDIIYVRASEIAVILPGPALVLNCGRHIQLAEDTSVPELLTAITDLA